MMASLESCPNIVDCQYQDNKTWHFDMAVIQICWGLWLIEKKHRSRFKFHLPCWLFELEDGGINLIFYIIMIPPPRIFPYKCREELAMPDQSC